MKDKLKTIDELDKNIECDNLDGDNCIGVNQLKQEAIKYIKEYRKSIEKHSHNSFVKEYGYISCVLCRNKYVQMRWIGMFFGIKESDLK